MSDFNAYQRAIADNYEGGEFAHVTSADEDVGDTLFTFLLRELSTSEGTDTPAEALRRVTLARLQLQEMERVLYKVRP